jgi:hypothetical protein
MATISRLATGGLWSYCVVPVAPADANTLLNTDIRRPVPVEPEFFVQPVGVAMSDEAEAFKLTVV